MIKLIDYLVVTGLVTDYRGIQKNNTMTDIRMLKIKKYHEEHPNSNQNDLITFIPETKYMVNKYWRDVNE